MDYKITGYEPAKLFHYFEEISAIPRGSGNEKGISDYLVAFANIINLIDGLDGLATGICGIASFTMFSMAVLAAMIAIASTRIASRSTSLPRTKLIG